MRPGTMAVASATSAALGTELRTWRRAPGPHARVMNVGAEAARMRVTMAFMIRDSSFHTQLTVRTLLPGHTRSASQDAASRALASNLGSKGETKHVTWTKFINQFIYRFYLFLKYISVNKSIYTGIHGNSSQLFYRSYLQNTPQVFCAKLHWMWLLAENGLMIRLFTHTQ